MHFSWRWRHKNLSFVGHQCQREIMPGWGCERKHEQNVLSVTVLPTNSWKAALAARRTCTSRSKRATTVRWRAKPSAWGARVPGDCVLARDHRAYAVASRTFDPIEWAPLRRSKYNPYINAGVRYGYLYVRAEEALLTAILWAQAIFPWKQGPDVPFLRRPRRRHATCFRQWRGDHTY